MNNIKQLFSSLWVRVVVVGLALLDLVYWVMDLLNEKDELEGQVSNINTAKKADVLEAQVQQNLDDASLNQKQIAQKQQTLDQLQKQREELPKQKELSPQEVEKYWQNN